MNDLGRFVSFILDYLRVGPKLYHDVERAAIEYFVDNDVACDHVVDRLRKAFTHLASTCRIRPRISPVFKKTLADGEVQFVPGPVFAAHLGLLEEEKESPWSEEIVADLRRFGSWPFSPFTVESIDEGGSRHAAVVTDEWRLVEPPARGEDETPRSDRGARNDASCKEAPPRPHATFDVGTTELFVNRAPVSIPARWKAFFLKLANDRFVLREENLDGAKANNIVKRLQKRGLKHLIETVRGSGFEPSQYLRFRFPRASTLSPEEAEDIQSRD